MFRDKLTKDDIKVYAAVLEKPGGSFANASKWYDVVSSHLAQRFVAPSLSFNGSDFIIFSFLFIPFTVVLFDF